MTYVERAVIFLWSFMLLVFCCCSASLYQSTKRLDAQMAEHEEAVAAMRHRVAVLEAMAEHKTLDRNDGIPAQNLPTIPRED